jgi:hypothetical protein
MKFSENLLKKFVKKAEKEGMDPIAFANHVLHNEDDFDQDTYHEACATLIIEKFKRRSAE